MHHFELRVHIAAPSMVRDDKRWKSIAEGVTNFKPASRVIISDGTSGTIHQELSSAGEDQLPPPTQPLSQFSNATRQSSDGIPVLNSISLISQDAEDSRDRSANGKRRAERCSDTEVGAAKRTKRTSYARAKKGLNPAFKNQIPGVFKVKKPADQTPRPHTATEATVLVPVTTCVRAQRSNSDATLNTAIIADSPLNALLPNDYVVETSFFQTSFSRNENRVANPYASFSRDGFETHGFPANQEGLRSDEPHDEDSIQTDDTTFRLSQTSIHESDIIFGTSRTNFKKTHSAGQDERHGKGSSRLGRSTSSTESPSNLAQSFVDLSPLAQRSTHIVPSIVDLTVEDEPKTPKVQCRDVLGPVSSPVQVVDQTPDDDTITTSHEAFLDAIQRFPRRIKCQASNTNTNRQFKSFIPDFMVEIAQQYNLVELFQPFRAPDSLRNSERGYWKMLVRITDLATVAKAKRKSPTTSQWSEQRFMLRQRARVEETATTPERDAILRTIVYPTKSADSYDLWTAEQFIQFWSYLTKTVERGRAGYDARATMDINPEDGRGLLVDVRFWCYAENLSHVWLILLGLSGELTYQMPLQWCVPGRGSVISMSGQPRNRGSIGRWIEKRSGVDGFWGLESTL